MLPAQVSHETLATFITRHGNGLARDILMQIDDPAGLAAAYGLDAAQWNALMAAPAFVDVLRRTKDDLMGAEGTMERIRRKAALVVEDTMLDMAEIVSDPKSTASARVSAFSEIRELAGLTSKGVIGGTGSAGGGPLVVINMGDSPKDRVIIGGVAE